MGLCLIYNIAFIISFESFYQDISKIDTFCEVITLKEQTKYNNKYIVKIVEKSKFKNTKLILYTNIEDNFMPGDILKVQGSFEIPDKPRNYKGFDYSNYLKQKKIYGSIFSNNSVKIFCKKDLFYIRGKILNCIFERSNKIYNQSGFINGILFGYTNDTENEIKESLKIANISHILAISGLHISYIIYFVSYILEKTIKNKKIENYIIIFFLIFFWFITGESISCARACIMTSISIISFNNYRKYNFYRSYIVSFFIILFFNPYNIFNIGMWLSYLGILGIKIFYDFFKTVFCHFNKKSTKIIQNISMSISVQIMIFPIVIYNFNIFSFTFLLSNIVIFLFVDKVIILGYISIFLSFINFNLGACCANINDTLINVFLNIINLLNKSSLSKIYLKTPYILFIVVYYFIIVLIFNFYRNNRHYILRLFCSYTFVQIQFKRLLRKKKYILVIIIIFFLLDFTSQFNKPLKFYFVDVEQGDCSIIKTPFGKSILIDSGERDYGKNIVLPYLLDRRINKLDYVIVSHFDSDHVGGILSIIDEIKVEQIIIGKQFEMNENYVEFLNLVKKNKIEVKIVSAGDELYIEKDLKLNILWPDSQNIINENSINNNSLVCKLIYRDFSILFTGDIEKIAEESILKKYKNTNLLKSNILKVAHHGSSSSSTADFLKITNSQIALIGVGENNNFGHPNKITLDNLKKFGYQIYRTDLNGEISMSIYYNGKIKIKIHIN